MKHSIYGNIKAFALIGETISLESLIGISDQPINAIERTPDQLAEIRHELQTMRDIFVRQTNGFGKRDLGCVIDQSQGDADRLNERTCEFAAQYGFEGEIGCSKGSEDYSDFLDETANEAVDFLNELPAPPYCSWYFEDNSLFLMPMFDIMMEQVDFVSSKEQDYPPDDYKGQWFHVSDHGNGTLYLRDDKGEDKELWSFV